MPDRAEGGNGTRYQLREFERRIERLEGYEPGVIKQRLDDLGDDVTALKRAFYTFCFGAVGAAVMFAFTVFALLGH